MRARRGLLLVLVCSSSILIVTVGVDLWPLLLLVCGELCRIGIMRLLHGVRVAVLVVMIGWGRGRAWVGRVVLTLIL